MIGTGRHCAAKGLTPEWLVNVDAIVFWLVWNAEKSILEVADFIEAITLSAQTALIGRHELARRNISLMDDPRLAD